MNLRALAIISGALVIQGAPLSYAQSSPPGNAQPCFTLSGTNEFAFDTGVLRGKLREGGKSTGLSSVVHVPTGTRLDSSMGLFSHYRIFSAGKRYGTAAWDWPSIARLQPDGSVEVQWPAAEDRPFRLRAIYRWTAPNTLDLETTVQATTNLARFESFVASYFTAGFTNASVSCRSNGQAVLLPADKGAGLWQAFPRDGQAVSIIQDGRWKILPNPVEWVIRPFMAEPMGVRSCPASGLRAIVTAPAADCFAVMTPYADDPHHSMYLSLFGVDLKAGETAHARARLVIDQPGG